MERFIYTAKLLEGKENALKLYLESYQKNLESKMENNQLMTISGFILDDQFYLYYECIGEAEKPESLFPSAKDYLKQWPNGSFFARMYDVFHYNRPLSAEHWQRKQKPQKFWARLAHLKPEKVSSYIYYHYQMQEEKPGNGDKYGIIGLLGNTLFFYCEEPMVQETALYDGLLKTHNTPDDKDWQPIMDTHFESWNGRTVDGAPWLELEMIFGL